MRTCEHPGCTEQLPTGRPGRPRKVCPEHTEKALALRALLAMPRCCQDANAGRVKGRHRTCKQHKQWQSFVNDNKAYNYNAARMRANGKMPFGYVPLVKRGMPFQPYVCGIPESISELADDIIEGADVPPDALETMTAEVTDAAA